MRHPHGFHPRESGDVLGQLRGGVGPESVQLELSNSICPVTEPKQWPSRSKIMFRMTQASVQKHLRGAGVAMSAPRSGRTTLRS
jgi:hypothetical protein